MKEKQMKSVTIASGSKGNCLYVKGGNTAILVDVGLTCSLLEEKMKLLGIEPSSISAILVTHQTEVAELFADRIIHLYPR